MRKKVYKTRRKIIVPKNCPFCAQNKNPDYKDTETLKRYISDRGKILGAMHTGICKKHQTRIARSVKQARYMALLPFIVRPQ